MLDMHHQDLGVPSRPPMFCLQALELVNLRAACSSPNVVSPGWVGPVQGATSCCSCRHIQQAICRRWDEPATSSIWRGRQELNLRSVYARNDGSATRGRER